eukprot:3818587-Rhodomonas_salina.2
MECCCGCVCLSASSCALQIRQAVNALATTTTWAMRTRPGSNPVSQARHTVSRTEIVCGITRFGDEYGTWCASWDDGICVPTKFVYDEGEHPCEGTHSGSCDELWPDLDWQKDQSQCCDSWCYVNPNTCNASEWGIDLQESLITRDLPAESKLWYSYGACPGSQISHWWPLTLSGTQVAHGAQIGVPDQNTLRMAARTMRGIRMKTARTDRFLWVATVSTTPCWATIC